MNTNIIGLVDCLNGNEDIKLWDKDKDGAFKIKTYSFKIFMFLCNFVYLQLVFFSISANIHKSIRPEYSLVLTWP